MTLDPAPRSPRYSKSTFGDIDYLHAAVTWDEAREEAAIFAINRAQETPLDLEVDARGLPAYEVREHLVLEHADRTAQHARCTGSGAPSWAGR